jgi:hypothetical protein
MLFSGAKQRRCLQNEYQENTAGKKKLDTFPPPAAELNHFFLYYDLF